MAARQQRPSSSPAIVFDDSDDDGGVAIVHDTYWVKDVPDHETKAVDFGMDIFLISDAPRPPPA